jgi:hypothetical protein
MPNKKQDEPKTIEEWTKYFEEYNMELLGYPRETKK